MKRRTVLGMLAGAGTVGSSILSGCVKSLNSSNGNRYGWTYDEGGELAGITQGLLIGREGPAGGGQVFALDAGSGEVRWTYGETHDLTGYTDLSVADGVYFGYCGDDDCQELYALDLDGSERWTQSTNPGRGRPRLVDGTVYVGNDLGIVRAFDADSGAEQWSNDLHKQGFRVDFDPIVHVADVLYAEIGGLVALDLRDGSTIWRYTPDEQPIVATTVSDGVGYLVTPEQVFAIEDGQEVWSRTLEENEAGAETEIVGLASGYLIVLAGDNISSAFYLHAFDIATGEIEWVSDPIEHPNVEYDPSVELFGDVVYVGTGRLRALDANSGGERWQRPVDEGEVQSVTVVEETSAGDHSVVIHSGETLVRFSSDGERTWSDSVDEDIRDYLVDVDVFVATAEGMYAIEQ